jgi:hypothetical protein
MPDDVTQPGAWRQFLKHTQVGRRAVGDALDRSDPGGADGPLEEPTSCLGITREETNTSTTWPDWSTARQT